MKHAGNLATQPTFLPQERKAAAAECDSQADLHSNRVTFFDARKLSMTRMSNAPQLTSLRQAPRDDKYAFEYMTSSLDVRLTMIRPGDTSESAMPKRERHEDTQFTCCTHPNFLRPLRVFACAPIRRPQPRCQPQCLRQAAHTHCVATGGLLARGPKQQWGCKREERAVPRVGATARVCCCIS